MADLFRGYDLTTMVETVAEKEFERLRQTVISRDAVAAADPSQVPTWESLSPVDKRNYKEQFLPVVTDILEAMESVSAPVKPLIDRRDMKWLVNEVEISRMEAITLIASGEVGLTDRAALYLGEQEDD